MVDKKFDFAGYATKAGLKCSDGRTILKDAFKDMNGAKVPLVWQHLHSNSENVLGHALLEYKPETGDVYAYCFCNESPQGKNAKELVKHGDIVSLSIFANDLVQNGMDVSHGVIREVSLVLAGANPGAKIDNVSFAHSDGSVTESEEDAIIQSGLTPELPQEEEPAQQVEDVQHAAGDGEGKTVKDVIDGMNEEQQNVLFALVAAANDAATGSGGEAQHSDEGDGLMKKNVFDGSATQAEQPTLSHEQFTAIQEDALKRGSFMQALMHAAPTYGITNIEYLFPDVHNATNNPIQIMREQAWVDRVYSGSFHTPFSRLKTTMVDLTVEEVRARGYVKASLKKELVVGLTKRTTSPTTVYIKAKLDRDDVIDITDMNVVAWQNAFMGVMLKEEIARAILLGDGRDAENADKIDEKCIIPIYTDDDAFAHHVKLASSKTNSDMIDEIIRARKYYKGSGSPTLFCTTDQLTEWLLLKDQNGLRIYRTEQELAAALRVSEIVEVPLMENVTRDITDPAPATLALKAIIVNMKDYSVGADKGGQVTDYEDFDIDYNQMKYLKEGRCSGMLTNPKSALVIEQEVVVPPAG